MTKIKKAKKPVRLEDKTLQEGAKARASADNAEGRKMDFGGLPNRDLKKNLGGCG